MSPPPITPSQTVGPFFHDCLFSQAAVNVLVRPETIGERIRLEGQVVDGEGAPVPDAMIELWQANTHGRYRHPADDRGAPLDPAFLGWGRARTDEQGRCWFETIRPGAVPGSDGQPQAPHISLLVLARGLLDHLPTRIYFGDRPDENAVDPVLRTVPEVRRSTLIATRQPHHDPPLFRFDVVLQGPGETVFFGA